jgi:hypothetical protein
MLFHTGLVFFRYTVSDEMGEFRYFIRLRLKIQEHRAHVCVCTHIHLDREYDTSPFL